MKKLFLFSLALVFALTACSDDDNGDDGGTPSSAPVTNASSLSSSLNADGAARYNGDLPTLSQYSSDFTAQSRELVVTNNGSFDFYASSQSTADNMYMLLKVDSTDEFIAAPMLAQSGGRAAKMKQAWSASGRVQDGENMVYVTFTISTSLGISSSVSWPATVMFVNLGSQSVPTNWQSVINSSNCSAPDDVNIRVVPTGTGDLTITLTWNTDNTDLDLWLSEPGGDRIYYADRTLTDGDGNTVITLDYDDTDGYGPENIYATGEGQLPSGTYGVRVHYYSGSLSGQNPSNYTLTINNGGSVRTERGTINKSSGSSETPESLSPLYEFTR